MIAAGLGFKIAAVPFHLWAPDTYEGAPAPAAAFIASVSKVASFALLISISYAILWWPAMLHLKGGGVIRVHCFPCRHPATSRYCRLCHLPGR
jgi:NADH-quinone oxidoreductase subunit N